MTPRNCTGCGVGLRTKAMPESKFPGTKVHKGDGRCGVCYEIARPRTTKNISMDRPGRPTLAQLLRERDRFEASRRARGVPVGGRRHKANAKENAA